MAKTLVVAEKPSVARDLASTLPGSFKQSKDKTHLETQDGSTDNGGYIVTWAVGHLVGLAPPGRVRPEAEEVALRRPPDPPREVQADPERRARRQAAARHPPADGRRRGRADRQRLRRRARGRADLRVRLRPGSGAQAGAAAVAVVDDEDGHPRGVRAPAPGRGAAVAGGGGPLALRGRLARGHERHARGLDPAAGGVRRRGLARTRADAHARPGRAPRGGDPQLRAGAVLARRGALRGHGRAPLRRPLPGRQAAAVGGRGAGDRRRGHAARPARSRSSRRPSSASSRSCSTTSRACSGTRTACTASRRAGRSRPRSACTRTTRRSPTRVRTRAS